MKNQKNCLKCKYCSNAYVSLDDPWKALFYCEEAMEIFDNLFPCESYQEKSRKEDD